MTDLSLTITSAAADIRSGRLSSVELVKAMFARADELDADLGIYLHRMDESALASAAIADAELAAGIDRGELHGIPIGVKDIIATKDGPTTAQSEVLDPAWGENVDAPVIARLREAGAVIMGKTTTMEFAIGMPDPAKPFPVPRNPWNREHWPGGSSSGSGSGVAVGAFLGSLGTDTGGSVRMPAAFCGISGIKQTFGRVPKSGCVALGFSFDHIGPLARSARDCAIMLRTMAGHDPSDLTSVDEPVPDYPAMLNGNLKGVRIGVEREHHLSHPAQDPEIVTVFEDAVQALKDAGADVREVVIPHFETIGNAGSTASRAESYPWHHLDLRDRRQLYGKHTADILMTGSAVTGWQFVLAQRVRAFGKKVLADLMADLDVIVTPTSGAGAPRLDTLDAEYFFKSPGHTRFWNAVGHPAMVVPMGFNNAGLPLSLEVVAKPFAEAMAFSVADAYQQITDWHLQVPKVAVMA